MRERQIGTQPASRRIKKMIMVLLPLVLATACEQYPRDPRDSLNEIEQSGTLDVGVIANPPWIMGSAPGSPDGVEARLMEQFAQDLGVDVAWHWGNEAELFEALSRYELDLVVGGITAGNPWGRHVGFTLPYFSSHAAVDVPREHVLAIPKGENALLMRLENFLLANADQKTITSLIARESEQ